MAARARSLKELSQRPGSSSSIGSHGGSARRLGSPTARKERLKSGGSSIRFRFDRSTDGLSEGDPPSTRTDRGYSEELKSPRSCFRRSFADRRTSASDVGRGSTYTDSRRTSYTYPLFEAQYPGGPEQPSADELTYVPLEPEQANAAAAASGVPLNLPAADAAPAALTVQLPKEGDDSAALALGVGSELQERAPTEGGADERPHSPSHRPPPGTVGEPRRDGATAPSPAHSTAPPAVGLDDLSGAAPSSLEDGLVRRRSASDQGSWGARERQGSGGKLLRGEAPPAKPSPFCRAKSFTTSRKVSAFSWKSGSNSSKDLCSGRASDYQEFGSGSGSDPLARPRGGSDGAHGDGAEAGDSLRQRVSADFWQPQRPATWKAAGESSASLAEWQDGVDLRLQSLDDKVGQVLRILEAQAVG